MTWRCRQTCKADKPAGIDRVSCTKIRDEKQPCNIVGLTDKAHAPCAALGAAPCERNPTHLFFLGWDKPTCLFGDKGHANIIGFALGRSL